MICKSNSTQTNNIRKVFRYFLPVGIILMLINLIIMNTSVILLSDFTQGFLTGFSTVSIIIGAIFSYKKITRRT